MKRLWRPLLLALVMISLFMPVTGQAASKVKIRYNGVKKSYVKKSTKVYINGKKKSIKSTPIFMKSGTYMGPLNKLFASSSLKVSCKQSGDTVALTYNDKTLVIKNGSRDVTLNGVPERKALGAAAMKGVYYPGAKKSCWVVPVKSICSRLGITYKLKKGVVYLTGSNNNGTTATTEVKPDPTPVNKCIVVLDAGHGGSDSGASANGYLEKHLNLAIVLGAKEYFDNDSRFEVYYTRTGDTYPSLQARAKLANDKNADIFVSVHNNWVKNTKTRGTLTLYNEKQSKSTQKNGITSLSLATAMYNAVKATTGFKGHTVTKDTRGLYVLKNTKMPSTIIEYGFISNKTEAMMINTNSRRYGKELYEAIVAYMKSCGRIQ